MARGLGFLAALLWFAGCVPIEGASPARSACTADDGFALGMNDGRAGREMDQRFADRCQDAAAGAARAGYRDGYREGLAARAAERPRARGWTCEVTPFSVTYSGAGALEAQAAAIARERCLEKESELFCRRVACREGM